MHAGHLLHYPLKIQSSSSTALNEAAVSWKCLQSDTSFVSYLLRYHISSACSLPVWNVNCCTEALLTIVDNSGQAI